MYWSEQKTLQRQKQLAGKPSDSTLTTPGDNMHCWKPCDTVGSSSMTPGSVVSQVKEKYM